MMTGPDISSHQHDSGETLDFAAVKAMGHSFVIVKATEGSGYANPWFVRDVVAARAAGLLVSPYHWVSPSAAGPQADNALAAVRLAGFVAGDLVWLDFEENGATEDVLHGVADSLEAAGFRIGVYTYPDFWNRVGDGNCQLCPKRLLWFADYNKPSTRSAPSPWTVVHLRQTDGTAVAVSGIPGANDMSHTENSGEFLIWPHLSHTTPAPTEDPDMARLITEDSKSIFGTDGVRCWHVPNPPILASLISSGVYGDGKVTKVPAGTVASMEAAEK